MNDPAQPPVPDVLGSRSQQQDDVVGPPTTTSELPTFEEAIGQHPDLGQMWLTTRAAFEAMMTLNNEIARAAEAGVALPPAAQMKLGATNMAFCRELDKVMNLLEDEQDAVRSELLKSIYTNLAPAWQQLVLQTHLARAAIRAPKRMHEMLAQEAMALLQRAQAGG